jgi:hypothetical protein
MKARKYNKKIYIFSFAWGEHLKWYFDYTLPSLMNSTNAGALIKDGYEIKYLLYTIDKKVDIVQKFIKKDKRFKQIEIIEFDKGDSNLPRKIAVYPVLDILRRCLDDKAILFLALADHIFGNYSFYNSVTYSYGKNKCLAASNGRVSVDILDSITPYPKQGFENSKLVDLCMKFPHDSLKYADDSLDNNMTHLGVSYRKLSSSLYAVTHNLPGPFLIFPIMDDYRFFEDVKDFNQWDRRWLELLIRTKRLKIIGSSDLFFFVELTSLPYDVKRDLQCGQKYNDEIMNPDIHNQVSNMVTSVWRSESK